MPRARVTEEDGEELRLAYVALTRARHQAVIWWAGTRDTCTSPLSRLAFAREEDGTVRPRSDVPSDEDAAERFRRLGEAGGRVHRGRALRPGPAHAVAAARATRSPALDRALRPRDRPPLAPHVLQRDHRRYPRPGRDERAGGTAARRRGARRAAVRSEASDEEAALRDVPSLLGDMPGGTRVGTFVHHVLEAVDFAAADLESQLQSAMARELARRPLDVGDPAAVLAGMRAVLETPLGTAAGGVRLADIAARGPAGRAGVRAAARRRRRAERAADARRGGRPAARTRSRRTPLHGYADRLGDERLQRDLRGYLTGSIDAVLRLPGDRFAIVDYKTNRLAGPTSR